MDSTTDAKLDSQTSNDTAISTAATATSAEMRAMEYFLAGDCIIRQGDDDNHAYKLIAGVAKVIKGGDVICTIYPDEYMGSIAALTEIKRNATVVASTDCVVQRIPRDRFTDLIQRNPDILKKIR